MDPPPCGFCASFVSLRAHVTLGVQLSICVSSPDRNTSVRLEFSPTVPLSVLFYFWAGQNYMVSRTALSTTALCLFPVHVAVNTHLLLVWLTILPSSPLLPRVSVPVSGHLVSTMIFWKGVSFPLGMAIDLISLHWAILRSSSLASASTSLRSTYEAWKAGTLTKASLLDIAPSGSIAVYFSTPRSTSFGSSSRSCLCSLWKVSPVLSTVVLPDGSACTTSSTPTVSSLRARSRSPCRMKKPLVLLRPRGDVSSVVTGAPPGSLSARCVVFTTSPCLIIISPFFPVL